MSSTTKLTVKQVAVISRTHANVRNDSAAYFAAKDDAALARVVRATAASLRALTVAGVEAEVRLPASKVTSMLWVILKAAKRAQVVRREAEAEALALFDERANAPSVWSSEFTTHDLEVALAEALDKSDHFAMVGADEKSLEAYDEVIRLRMALQSAREARGVCTGCGAYAPYTCDC